jgi:hypothetical protein
MGALQVGEHFSDSPGSGLELRRGGHSVGRSLGRPGLPDHGMRTSYAIPFTRNSNVLRIHVVRVTI